MGYSWTGKISFYGKKIFYKDAKVIVFVYDITNQPNFDGLKNYWHEQTKINSEK